ncbi:MAG TPA: PfkB family carbohydrate kinase, partial [Conexibacter sp.]|nr:PfkB family carbohydrate kinase [Conexibacter sp.]
MSAAARAGVAVVGSLNWDVTYRLARLPAAGETTNAPARFAGPGGKGANQALAAARLGAAVAMVGCVGTDEAGAAMRDALAQAGVDVRHVEAVEGSSGSAVVLVQDDGENSIVIHPGANARLGAAHVRAAADVLGRAAVVLLGLEVPLEAARAAAELCRGVVVLNPAPAPAEPLPAELLRRVDLLVPNRGELGALAGVPAPESGEQLLAAARRVAARALVVTLGSGGALLCADGAEPLHVPAAPARTLDTTGAGDAFCGALADGLARGLTLEAA